MKLQPVDTVIFLTFIGGTLVLTRLFGEASKRLKLSSVFGEISLGILLGPTVLGTLLPGISAHFYPPPTSPARLAINVMVQLSVIMLLFVAGLEVRLHTVVQQGKAALLTSVTSMTIPFVLGFTAMWLLPAFFRIDPLNRLIPSLFFGIAMAVSALPVIARILMDLQLFQTRVGMTIMAAAVFDDLTGWMAFAFVLSMFNGQKSGVDSLWQSAVSIGLFAVLTLTIGRRIVHACLPWMEAHFSRPGGVIAFCFGLGCLGAAFTESIGLHALLGAFLVGIAIGDSSHLRDEVRVIFREFVMSIFAPLFFVSVGLGVNFVTDFDPALFAVVLFLAMFCKISGGFLGARLGGMVSREALAVGLGLNARGVMEIILGTMARDAGLIDQRMLVALICMALTTSLLCAPLMRRVLAPVELT